MHDKRDWPNLRSGTQRTKPQGENLAEFLFPGRTKTGGTSEWNVPTGQPDRSEIQSSLAYIPRYALQPAFVCHPPTNQAADFLSNSPSVTDDRMQWKRLQLPAEKWQIG
jgi:hypothetical protein